MNITFNQPDEQQRWQISNDTVMGGISRSQVRVNAGVLTFNGQLSLENNGGFASVWRQINDALNTEDSIVRINARGDGRVYQLRFRLADARGISYTAQFTTTQQWQWHSFTESDFKPVWRGRTVIGAPPMRFDKIVAVGILLADKVAGSFTVELQQIEQREGPTAASQLSQSTD